MAGASGACSARRVVCPSGLRADVLADKRGRKGRIYERELAPCTEIFMLQAPGIFLLLSYYPGCRASIGGSCADGFARAPGFLQQRPLGCQAPGCRGIFALAPNLEHSLS